MRKVYNSILKAAHSKAKLLAILIDPEKFVDGEIASFLRKIPESTTHFFIGGSTVPPAKTEACVELLKKKTNLPIILFPGDCSQITPFADALLFLSLISGRNPEYLIDQQVRSVGQLRKMNLEIIPTGYILIDGGKMSSVQRVSKTEPLSQDKPEEILHTAVAGEYSGKKLIYLEAGSGAKRPVSKEIISAVKEAIHVPLIVGGGICSSKQLNAAYEAGADMVVVGTAFEKGVFFTS